MKAITAARRRYEEMTRSTKRWQAVSGFTIIELAVIISVIGILAMITIFSIGNWRTRTAQNEVQNDLHAASAAMENGRIFNNSYPATIPSSFSPSANVTVSLKTSTAGGYCIEAKSKVITSVVYSIRSDSRTPVVGNC